MSSSTLIETVSINYEDFSESFLTCSTCLCPYDQGARRPKLLACSHTVCSLCLERIAELPQVCLQLFLPLFFSRAICSAGRGAAFSTARASRTTILCIHFANFTIHYHLLR